MTKLVRRWSLIVLAASTAFASAAAIVRAQDRNPIRSAPPRAEGEGPFKRLVLRGVNLINGTGSPMVGPVDIVIEVNKIAQIVTVGLPQVTIDPRRHPKLDAGDKELDFSGKYVLPGFVDMHAH